MTVLSEQIRLMPGEGKFKKHDEVTQEHFQWVCDFLDRVSEYDAEGQLARQNAEPIHTAFRLNGKLVATIGVNFGMTGTGITDGGAYLKAQAEATERGLYGQERDDFVNSQVVQALKERYGYALEVITYDPDKRPTAGELHAEMFGEAQPVFENSHEDQNAFSLTKYFTQLLAQAGVEDGLDGHSVPFET